MKWNNIILFTSLSVKFAKKKNYFNGHVLGWLERSESWSLIWNLLADRICKKIKNNELIEGYWL